MNDKLMGMIVIIVAIGLLSNLKKLSFLKMPKVIDIGGGGANLTLVAGWFVFVAIAYNMHPKWWDVWYGTEAWSPNPQFLLAQVIVLGTIFALPKEGFLRGTATTALVLAIAFSFHSGFITGAIEGGLISGNMSEKAQRKQKWIMYSPDKPDFRYPAQVITTPLGKLEMTQYSRIARNKGETKFNGGCDNNGRCKGTMSTKDNKTWEKGWFKLERITSVLYAGSMKGDRLPGKKDTYEVPFYVVLQN